MCLTEPWGGGRGKLGLSKAVWEHLSRPAACLVLSPLTVLEMPPAQSSVWRSISSLYLGGKFATPLAGGTRGLLQPIPCVRATSSWVRSSPSSWAVLRAVCKEELPIRGRGRAGSCPVTSTNTLSFWPDLLMTFVVVHPSGGRSLLARAGSVFPCTQKVAFQSAPALPLHWSSQAGDVFRGLIFNLHPTEEENL